MLVNKLFTLGKPPRSSAARGGLDVTRGSRTYLKPAQAMDSAGVAGVREMFEAAGSACLDTIVDLDGVRVMDGAGLGAIAALTKTLARNRRTLSIVNVSGQPLEMLERLGLSRMVFRPDTARMARSNDDWPDPATGLRGDLFPGWLHMVPDAGTRRGC